MQAVVRNKRATSWYYNWLEMINAHEAVSKETDLVVLYFRPQYGKDCVLRA